MMRAWVLIACSLLAGSGWAQPTLELTDMSGSVPGIQPIVFYAIPFHPVRIRITGPAQARTVLAVSANPAPSGLLYNGTPVTVDPSSLIFLWDGISDPSAPAIGASGTLDVFVTIPWPVPIGEIVWMQAAVIPPAGPAALTGGVVFRWSGEPVSIVETGNLSMHPLAVTSGSALITDGPTWATFYGLHGGPTVLPPPIDFTTQFVYARFLGISLYPNVWVSVDEMVLGPAQVLHVYVTQFTGGIQPVPGTVQPYMFVTAPRSLLGLTVQEELRQIFAP